MKALQQKERMKGNFNSILRAINNLGFAVLVTSCTGKGTNIQSFIPLDYQVVLETITRGEDQDYIWTHARSAAIPSDTPVVITTMSKTLKSGSDVYHDLYETLSRNMGENWTEPAVIPSLKVQEVGEGYRSMADMWPGWHSANNKILSIGTSPFYSDNKTHDGWKKEVTYAVYDPETEQWSPPKQLILPERDHEGRRFMAPAAGSAQWVELPNGDILLPIFYFKVSDEQASMAISDPESFSVSNMMANEDLRFATTVVLCSFDGEALSYKEHGDEITLDQGRGIYEPSITYYQEEYFLTMRSDKSAYVAKSSGGLHFTPVKEWTFDDGSILGSYNTQQHWASHSEGLFLVYTRRGADNDEVFRHRAPLFMAEVKADNLDVIRATERVVVPNRGAALGNFGIAEVNKNETWVTVAEYMRGEENVAADNSVFVARIQWSKPNEQVE